MGANVEPTFELLVGGETAGSVQADALPLALADLHRELSIDETASVRITPDPARSNSDPFALCLPQQSSASSPASTYRLRDAVVGAGFEQQTGAALSLRRVYSLADTVGPSMRVLICGLNPSPYSAEVGVGFGRPGNRFWPAAIAAGLAEKPHDPRAALTEHGVGMTDLVKRPTRRASELSTEEYKAGIDRVQRLVGWLRPHVVCFVGLAGWRSAVERTAKAGWQTGDFGGAPVYLMPSTSGLNASSQLPDLTAHFRDVVAATN